MISLRPQKEPSGGVAVSSDSDGTILDLAANAGAKTPW
jgi:hypothetical protein